MPILSFTSSQSWTVPAYSTMTITVEGGTGANGTAGANIVVDGDTTPGGSGGVGGVGGKSVKSLTSGTGPTAGSSLTLNIGGITAISAGPGSRFTFGTNPTAYDGGAGGNGTDAYYGEFGPLPGTNGTDGAHGTATGGDTNTTAGSSKSVATITIEYTSPPVEGVGSASGVAAASAQGRGIASATGAATGLATVAAVGGVAEPTGYANGLASVSGVGSSTASAAGVSAGVAEAIGLNVNTIAAVGVSAGVATAVGKNYQPSRIIVGKLPSGAYGMRVSVPGYNASLDPVDDQKLIFSSEWPDVMPIYQRGSFVHRVQGDQGNTVTQEIDYTTLGYVPFCDFTVRGNGDALPAGSDTFLSDRYYPYDGLNLSYWDGSGQVSNSGDANAYLRLNVTADKICARSFVRNLSGSTQGLPRTWTIYYTIYRKQTS